MSLSLYNTLGRRMEDFVPIREGEAGIYGCGPTVYNFAHIGNLRPYVFQDILVRTLHCLGYKVNHVMNVTDVGHLTGDDDTGEDKMVKTAIEKGRSVLEIAEFYTGAFFEDCEKLNIRRPTVVCKATEHVADMIALIQRIEAKGYTYLSNGNLYFDISKFPRYGEFAQIDLKEQKSGSRIEIDKNKANPYDFVLWFTKSKFENQALVWDSPWGRGYPGWHIECSAMSMKYLGERIDIHTGGIDHIPIHHTNEIAQSEGATGKKWVNYWLHNEFLIIDKGKMSKSKGGFLTLSSILEAGYEALDYRYFLLGGHYRSQLQFSFDSLESARSSRKNLTEKILSLKDKAVAAPLAGIGPKARAYLDSFMENAMADLSTPRCLSDLWGLLRDGGIAPAEALCVAFEMDKILGLSLASAERQEGAFDPAFVAEIESLIAERAKAKKEKDFSKADGIRGSLREKGIALEDGPSGTKWKPL